MRPIVLAVLLSSCSGDLALPEAEGPRAPAGAIEPVGSLQVAPPVIRVRVKGGARHSPVADYRLFEGELGAYHLGRIRERNLPKTLLERELPVLAWLEGKDVVVAPLAVLSSGKYSFATPELGLVAEVFIDASIAPVLERAWPPPELTTGSGAMIFCGDAARLVARGPVSLAPAGLGAALVPGLNDAGAFSAECVRVVPSESVPAGVPVLPPAFAGGVAFAPRALVATHEPAEREPCVPPQIELGPVCASVGDDRVEIRSAGAPAFLAFTAPNRVLGVVGPRTSLVLRGFEPASRIRLEGLVFDTLGDADTIDLDVETTSARPHVVLNEVFANPVGSEPAGEWIELVNDGTQPVELGGFVLDDAIEPVTLPACRLDPGDFALIVADAYAPDPELELVPEPDVALLRVPRLGRSGLANAGELLRLREPNGDVVSRFPALTTPTAGTSVARRTPDSPDTDTSAFGAHAPPGASPGRPNALALE